MTLTEFLLACIAEDELVARSAISARDREIARGHERLGVEPDLLMAWEDHPGPGVCLIGPERVLAECEAKRRIVADLSQVPIEDWHPETHPQAQWAAARTLRALALPYAGHDQYDERWRP